MVVSDEKKKEYIKRILISRMRILCNNGFYGLLLMHMDFSLDENCRTVATDGKRIVFSPDFLDKLNDAELDFVMMHEIIHVVLQHCLRRDNRNEEHFDKACDIVVNSNILLSNNNDTKSITLREYGESVHLAPDGKEGYNYTAEQVYGMFGILGNKKEESEDIGYLPDEEADDEGGEDSEEISKKSKRQVRSFKKRGSKTDGSGGGVSFAHGRAIKNQGAASDNGRSWDDHTRWGTYEDDDMLRDVWVKRFEDACEAISISDASNCRGLLPAFAKRMLDELHKPQTDWRTILNDFVQEEIVDYSFTPPDRRFDNSHFYLPDFNDKDYIPQDILFMIDTSGSMSNKMISAAYYEVKGAIDQFGGKLTGWLGFFDAAIIEPVPFESEEEFRIIKPAGGGGTDFLIIFEYVEQYMKDNPPVCIIILTDGYAPFPDETSAMGIPVLWLLNNESVNPPWGKTARIKI